jgi:hypothetical protein
MTLYARHCGSDNPEVCKSHSVSIESEEDTAFAELLELRVFSSGALVWSGL